MVIGNVFIIDALQQIPFVCWNGYLDVCRIIGHSSLPPRELEQSHLLNVVVRSGDHYFRGGS